MAVASAAHALAGQPVTGRKHQEKNFALALRGLRLARAWYGADPLNIEEKF
jgi:hypothetical protein